MRRPDVPRAIVFDAGYWPISRHANITNAAHVTTVCRRLTRTSSLIVNDRLVCGITGDKVARD